MGDEPRQGHESEGALHGLGLWGGLQGAQNGEIQEGWQPCPHRSAEESGCTWVAPSETPSVRGTQRRAPGYSSGGSSIVSSQNVLSSLMTSVKRENSIGLSK